MKSMLFHIKSSKFACGKRGSITVIVALSMTVILTMAALSIDVGLAYLGTGDLQTAVDAAVYSAGRMLPVRIDDIAAQNALKDNAILYCTMNGYDNLTRSNVLLGGESSGYYTDITVDASQTVELNFARAIGFYTIDFSRSAKAKLSPIIKTRGVAPLGITDGELSSILETGNGSHVVLKYGVGSGAGPFFGALDLDGQGGGASDYRIWLAQGYPGEICIGDILLEESGNMAGPTYSGFTARFDACTHYGAQTGGLGCTSEHYDPSCSRIVKVVVYSPNDKKTVKVSGFAAFLLEAQDTQGYITGTFLNIVSPGETSGGDIGSDEDFGLYNVVLAQ